MKLDDRIEILAAVGTAIKTDLADKRVDDVLRIAENENPWFVEPFVKESLYNLISNYLSKEKLQSWAKNYEVPKGQKTVGLITAGNIPFVGIHDVICCFVAGHKTKIKLSSKDSVLMKYFFNTLNEIDSNAAEYFETIERLVGFDAVIATGSNNTNRYFEHYFGKYPNLLRKNRTSIAVVDDETTNEQLEALTDDIYKYFGLGCRSVSKVFAPVGFDITRLLKACDKYSWLEHHNKFHNNYEYQKSVYLVNRNSHFDTGFSIFRENEDIHSPIGVTYFEYYRSLQDLSGTLKPYSNQIQTVVGSAEVHIENSVSGYGNAQITGLHDYADGVDVMEFLIQL